MDDTNDTTARCNMLFDDDVHNDDFADAITDRACEITFLSRAILRDHPTLPAEVAERLQRIAGAAQGISTRIQNATC